MTLGGGGTTQVAYGDKWYWEKRYAQEPGSYDWYQTYHSLAPLLRLYVHPHHRVLVVGCGNSAFSEGMVDDGYAAVVNVDISSVADMNMDVRDMSAFEAGSFDAIIDKEMSVQLMIANSSHGLPGTLDAILCGNDSMINAAQMLAEVCRVLKDEGKYILISESQNCEVLDVLLLCGGCTSYLLLHKVQSTGSSHQQKWELTSPIALDKDVSSVESVLGPNPGVHYIYVCVKKRKKKTYTKPKKIKHKHKKVKLAVLQFYKVDESGKVQRLRKECPNAECGAGTFMANHFDRHYCGKCGLTYVYQKGGD
nr:methyltransferase-like protein 13 [Ipomoea batatas]